MKSWFFKMAAALAVVLSLSGCGYNDFQRLDEATKSAWSEVVNQYQRRADLVQNLTQSLAKTLISLRLALYMVSLRP